MTIERMDHVGIVVGDLAAAVAFFVELGLQLDGEAEVGGQWVDRIIGLHDVSARIAMLQTPDRHAKIELTQFDSPPVTGGGDDDARGDVANALGIRHITFAVDDLDDVLARLRPHGAELIGEVVRYRDSYRLCYVRGPAGIIIELAEPIG